jgi:ATP/maltotriose-dependent transcriptional regulator MalT
MLAEHYLHSGKISDAIPLFEDAIEISLRINVPAFSVRSTHKLGDALFILGDYTKALELHMQAEQIVRNTNMMVMDGAIHVILGFGYVACYLGLEDYDKALDYCVTALGFNLNPSMSSWYVLCYPVTALMLWHVEKPLSAAELVGMIFSSPDHETGWLHQWGLFKQMCADLEVQLGAEVYQSILERGTRRELNEMIPVLLAHLTGEEVLPESVSQPLDEPLTRRELEVLALLADGLTNPEIADKLYLSTGTVKVHTRNIYGKLNVSNRTEAATTAHKLNLI